MELWLGGDKDVAWQSFSSIAEESPVSVMVRGILEEHLIRLDWMRCLTKRQSRGI